jgi:rhodanese-related sulfurtransferase
MGSLKKRLKTHKGYNVKFLIDNWMLISIAVASGGMLVWPMISGAMNAGALTASGAVQLINREKAVVVDVSEADEFAAGHVTGAKNVPFSELEGKLPATVKNKALPLILVCATGARAGRAVAVAKKLGYEQAQSLGGGLKAWKEANLPLEKA